MASTIQEGENVLFRRDKKSFVFNIRKNRQVYFEKSKFNVEALIGQPYGTTFEIDKGKLTRVEAELHLELTAADSATPGADNRNLQDLESNQKMSKEDIEKLKDDGVTGEKIIEKLIENSETFKTKTEFSQAKFIKKKKKKHLAVFTALRPTPRLIMDMFRREPGKICYLRADSLSQLLSYSNVMSGSCIAVAESCQGLVLACLLQRMGGSGRLIQLVPANGATCRNVLDYFSFPKQHLDLVYNFPLDGLANLEKSLSAADTNPRLSEGDSSVMEVEKCPTTNNGGSNGECVTMKEESTEAGKQTDAADVDDMKNNKKELEIQQREEKRQAKALRQKEAAEILCERRLDSLVLACKYNPVPVLKKMLKFIKSSKPVVVFCAHLEPLKDCYSYIKEQKLGAQVRLTETWFREYQVLEQRTHPEMNMSGTGGYLLTFMTLDPTQPTFDPLNKAGTT